MRLTGASREVRSLAFDPRILRARQRLIVTRIEHGEGSHQILNKRVVYNAEDWAFFVDQTEGDAAEREAVHEIRSAVCDA